MFAFCVPFVDCCLFFIMNICFCFLLGQTSLAAGQMPALAPVPEIAAPVPVQAPVVAAPPAGPPPLPSAPATEWSGAAVTYPAGAKVTFQGKSFVCTLAHNSQADWMPGAAVSLWQPVA